MSQLVRPLDAFGRDDVDVVGGKNASLGEMLRGLKEQGVRVPEGVAVTVEGYRRYIDENGIGELIDEATAQLQQDEDRVREVGDRLRRAVGRGQFPDDLAAQIRSGYDDLCERYDMAEVVVAVRSSATAEDLPDASFAGQQETVLNVTGHEDLLDAVRFCYTSLFTDRAIVYRARHGFDERDVSLSVTIQKMVRSSRACSGVMFTLEPDTGFPDVIVINGSWGLGSRSSPGTWSPTSGSCSSRRSTGRPPTACHAGRSSTA